MSRDAASVKGDLAARGTEPSHDAAVGVLCGCDPKLAAVIEAVGPCELGLDGPRDGFAALVRAIVNQQLSKRAAATIHERFLALFADRRPDPRALLAMTPETLLPVGLSRRKVEYLYDLAARVVDGRLDLDSLHGLPDDEAIASLIQVKGIGRWSAHMHLIFTLGRLDILPLDDVALIAAMRNVYDLPATATLAELETIAEAWRPHRSVACWYLYRHLDRQRERAAPPAAASRSRRKAPAGASPADDVQTGGSDG